MNLTKFQINVVKSMARELIPLQKKLDKIHAKEVEFLASIATSKSELQQQIDQINNAVTTYTGGLTINEVLNPASTVLEQPEGEVNSSETIDMELIIPGINTEQEETIEGFQESIPSEIMEEVEEVETTSTNLITEEVTETVPFWDKK